MLEKSVEAICSMVTGTNEHARFQISRIAADLKRPVRFQLDKRRLCRIRRGKLEHAYD